MKSPPLIILVFSKLLLYFENNGKSSQYKKNEQTKRMQLRLQKKRYSFPKIVGSNYCKPWFCPFISKFF